MRRSWLKMGELERTSLLFDLEALLDAMRMAFVVTFPDWISHENGVKDFPYRLVIDLRLKSDDPAEDVIVVLDTARAMEEIDGS